MGSVRTYFARYGRGEGGREMVWHGAYPRKTCRPAVTLVVSATVLTLTPARLTLGTTRG